MVLVVGNFHACFMPWPIQVKKTATKTRIINQFLLSMYMGAAGMLPDRCLDYDYDKHAVPNHELELKFPFARFRRGANPRKPSKTAEPLSVIHGRCVDESDEDASSTLAHVWF